MKKAINASVGGYSFIMEEDAYTMLSDYLDSFRSALDADGCKEVMDELEMRISDLFKEKLNGKEVVDIRTVKDVVDQLGLPGGEKYSESHHTDETKTNDFRSRLQRKVMRDPDGRMLGGVCSGLALYFDVDITIVRLAFVLAIVLGTVGIWAYLILWLIVPEARTAAEKCELRGLDANAENIRRFTSTNNYRK